MTHPLIPTEKYEAGTAKRVRKSGRVPAVIYGHNLKTSSVTVDMQEFRKAFRKAGRATLVEIEVEGKKIPSMIHEVVTHPVSGDPIHIDFYAVKMNEEVTASVPLHFTGTSDAVKLLGGILTIQHHQIEVKCLPKHLLSEKEVSLEPLKTFHDLITVADIVFPEEITVIDNPQTVIASVAAPRLGGDDADTAGDEAAAGAEGAEAKGEENASA